MKEFLMDIKEILLPALLIALLTTLIVIIPSALIGYVFSCKKAEVYNKLNNSSFTCSDFFWAEDQINSQSQTIKIN